MSAAACARQSSRASSARRLGYAARAYGQELETRSVENKSKCVGTRQSYGAFQSQNPRNVPRRRNSQSQLRYAGNGRRRQPISATVACCEQGFAEAKTEKPRN